MNYLENEFFLLAITFGIYFFAKLLQKKTGILLLNPILLTIAVIIIFLKLTNISFETYNQGGHLIEFWLKPAVVALGVPLYLQLETIKKQLLPIILSQLAVFQQRLHGHWRARFKASGLSYTSITQIQC